MAERPTAAQNAKEIRRLADDYTSLRAIVVGNGQPGMDEVVRDTQKVVEKLRLDFENYRKDEAENRRYWERLVVGALVAQLIAGATAAAVILIRIAPLMNEISKASL